jgi:hypothetical protein
MTRRVLHLDGRTAEKEQRQAARWAKLLAGGLATAAGFDVPAPVDDLMGTQDISSAGWAKTALLARPDVANDTVYSNNTQGKRCLQQRQRLS